jgi:glutamine synthetase
MLNHEPLIMVCTCEIAGRVRGKGFPQKDLPERLIKGVGWVPTNSMISCFGIIGDTPFGALGDLILVPDTECEVRVRYDDDSAPEHFFLGDIRETDGKPWACCPRDFLRRGLAALEAAAGYRLFSAFEQEFVYTGVEDLPGSSYSLDAYRRQGIFGEAFTGALRQAGVVPDSFLPEYGARQYETTCRPAVGLRAADDAIILREICRSTAQRLGAKAIFSPILDPKGIGNGVHIHMSFQDAEGKPVMEDPGAPYGLAGPARAFMAGVLKFLPAVCAVTAPSTISYIRLTPNRWAPTYAYIAERDREASLRICPVLTVPGAEREGQFNVEFRAGDGAASPYLALGAVVHAGVEGIRQKLELPPQREVAHMDDAARAEAGIRPLPRSLAEALDALEATTEAKSWFGPVFHEAYLRHKRAEIRSLDGLDAAAQCARYALTY